jgi:2-octaprenyl-6-methoxyphenol hydroxylase
VSTDELECDVLIAGGGLVGSTLALALSRIPLRTVVVEARDPGKLEQPSFDARVTALASGSVRILQALGLWEGSLRAGAEPIRCIHISERGRFGACRITASQEGVAALGYTVENRLLGQQLWSRLDSAPEVGCLAPAVLRSASEGRGAISAAVEAGRRRIDIRARLLVAADGARSPIRRAFGIAVEEDRYLQQALIVNCATEEPHRGRAFERFTDGGPLAVLPLCEDRVAVVWTMDEDAAARALALNESDFRRELQEAFGYRLGRILRTGARLGYPLARTRSAAVHAGRAVLVGNAALSLHPVAGQGFNLALRDVASLAEVLSDEARRAGARADVGAPALLRRYAVWRERDQRAVAMFTHGLIRLFSQPMPVVAAGRGLGLAGFDLLPAAKSQLARRMMGLAGRRQPRLARGLPL